MVQRMERQELAHRSGNTGFSEEIPIPKEVSHFVHETERLMQISYRYVLASSFFELVAFSSSSDVR